MVTALFFGLLIGGVLGVAGAGGSILAVPALMFGLGLPLAAAIPSSLLVVGASSAVGVLPRLPRGVNWRLALIIGTSGSATAYLGTVANRSLNQRDLLLAFAAIMVLAGIRMLIPIKSNTSDRDDSVRQVKGLKGLSKALVAGGVLGFLTGLLGVGGGFLIVPALTMILGLPMALAVGTSLVIIFINSTGAFIFHLTDMEIDWNVTAAFAATAMIASFVSGRLGRSLSDKALKRGFAVLVLLVAVYVIFQARHF